MSDLSDLVSMYITKRNERLAIERQAQIMKESEDEIKLKLITAMKAEGFKQARTDKGLVTYSSKPMPIVKDWPALYAHIKDTDSFDLLQRRVHEGAVALRTEEGIKIPGVDFFPVDKITVSG